MKYKVKAGAEFENVKLTLEVEKQSTFSDWKNLTVLFVFLSLIIGVAYAKVTGDTTIFDKVVDAVVKVATEHPEKDDGKESKNHPGST